MVSSVVAVSSYPSELENKDTFLTYNSAGEMLPYPIKALESTVEVIESLVDSLSIIDIYYPCVTFDMVKDSVSLFRTDEQITATQAFVESFRQNSADALFSTRTKPAGYNKSDGGFSYMPDYSASTAYGKPVALSQTAESDIIGTYDSILTVIYISEALDIPRIPLYGAEDLERFNSIICNKSPIEKIQP